MHECDRDKGMGALLHNLKRALLLEDSMNVKKIRRSSLINNYSC